MTKTAIPDLWDDKIAASLSEPGLLLYRSNLLGSDLRITNFGGGNTSAKVKMTDPLTRREETVLWVKGSGGDLGSMKLDGFSTLYLDKLYALKGLYRGIEHEDEMVDYLPHCTFNLNPRAASIDTPLHGFVPALHVDHMHADAVIAIAAAKDSERLTKEVFGIEMGYLPWQRPGFDLGLKLGEMAEKNPHFVGVVLGAHGLFTWGPTAKESYQTTLRIINKAADWLEGHRAKPSFKGARFDSLDAKERADVARRLMPEIRGRISKDERKIGHFTDGPEVLDFVNSNALDALAPLGTSCPDHFLRTKIRPLVLPYDPKTRNLDAVVAGLDETLESYARDYAAYYERAKHSNSPKMRDPNPVVILVPGVGRLTFAADKTTARLAGEFYGNAINVMRGAEVVGGYAGLAEQEAFNIEYWALEEAKLRRMPKPRPLVGKIAFVTGAAGGIGAATAQRLLADGACVMLVDRDAAALDRIHAQLGARHGSDAVRAAVCDVTDEAQVKVAFDDIAVEFGGLDILVANAGIASSAPIEETTVALWRRNYDVLVEGYFLSARAAFPLMKQQGGGSVIFIGSKNALAATPNASAYASAKAAAVHLARCLALEGADFGIRVNVVNPDAVIRGSRIWDGEWRKERAGAYSIDPGDELEEFYRKRSLLKLNVLSEDVAEAVHFFASNASVKSTGNIINVDAGNAQAFTR
jgi:rhamnulose-1-phosphate aldolase/alcohol dehydrogenase